MIKGCGLIIACILLFFAFLGLVVGGVTLYGASLHEERAPPTTRRINLERQAE